MQTTNKSTDEHWMQLALAHAKRGLGSVEPNPMVGCVLVMPNNESGGRLIGEGYHEKFGGPHAEAAALKLAGEHARGTTAYVTLEPCSHHGKTGPCADAIIKADVSRVVVATLDPFEKVAGQGVAKLRDAGIQVDVGVCEGAAKDILAPYLKRVTTGMPWIIAKWAMTWDGKIATASGDSQWISNEQSREIVHDLRRRVDAIMVGSTTARVDNPLLTARPAGSRTAIRVVIDSQLALSHDSQLVKTAKEVPVLICAGANCDDTKRNQLIDAGVEVWLSETQTIQTPTVGLTMDIEESKTTSYAPIGPFLKHLADRGCTNVLVEGGGGLMGVLFDQQQIDEVHCFLGPKLIGGMAGLQPIGGAGVRKIVEASQLRLIETKQLGDDIYMIGRTAKA